MSTGAQTALGIVAMALVAGAAFDSLVIAMAFYVAAALVWRVTFAMLWEQA